MFPLGKTGGLIEAARLAGMVNGILAVFPLGKTGGLIEARYGEPLPDLGPPGFRWVKPAASLKHGRCGDSTGASRARVSAG